MKKILLCFIAASCCASCSEPEENPQEKGNGIVFQPTNTFVSTYAAEYLLAYEIPIYETIDGFYLAVAFNRIDACDLSQETYMWFEVLTHNRLKFIDEDADDEGVLHITEDMRLLDYAPWRPYAEPEYDYYRLLPAAASEEGVYIFALKCYQPGTGQYYTTPYYWMRLWPEGESHLYAEIKLLEP